MNNSIQALRERRNVVAKNLHELMNGPGKDAWNDDLQAKYDAGMKEIEELNAKIKRIDDFNASLAESSVQSNVMEAAGRLERDQGSVSAKLFAKWLRVGDQGMSSEDWTQIRATMSTTTSSEGGYTVQTDVAKSVADALKAFGGMREVADVMQTASGNAIQFPTSDGTGETGEQVAENTTVTNLDGSFGVINMAVYKYSSKTVAVPFELLQDSSVDIEAYVRNRLVQRIGRITNTKFTAGSGTSEPRGALTAAAAGKVGATGQTVGVISDDLIDLVHSVDPAYRGLGRCRFMMNDGSLKVMRKLKDTSGRPIFMPGYEGLSGAMADSILGYPVTINQDIPVMAANAKSILFGDFKFYMIRDVLQQSFFRFTDSAYAQKGQVGFLMFARSGGNYLDVGGGLKYYQNSAT